jgi:glycosyltransferase involved in cell wall biosynthesis
MSYKFSIVTVVYNAKDDLEKTVGSIQSQKFRDFEHIIVDGGSSDGTVVCIKSLECDNVKFISEKDNGIYDAMNKGIDLASGEYLLFLNAADTFASDDVLENIAKKIKQEKPNIIYGGANVYSEDGKFVSSLKPFNINKKNLNRYATRVVCHQSIFVHRDIVKPYSDKYRLKGELNWYYNLVESTNENEIVKLDEMICNYFFGGTGDKNFWENYIERLKVTKEHNSMFGFLLVVPFFLIPLLFRLRRILFGK